MWLKSLFTAALYFAVLFVLFIVLDLISGTGVTLTTNLLFSGSCAFGIILYSTIYELIKKLNVSSTMHMILTIIIGVLIVGIGFRIYYTKYPEKNPKNKQKTEQTTKERL